MSGRKKTGTESAAAPNAQQLDGANSSPEQSQIDVSQGNVNNDVNSQQPDAGVGTAIGDDAGNGTEDQNATNQVADESKATASDPVQVEVPKQEDQSAIKPIVVTSDLSYSVTIPPIYVMVGAGQRVEIHEADSVKRQQIVSNLEQLKQMHRKLSFSY